MTPMKPAAAKVGGNQGRMAGRRRAVGFLQIVPGVFPTGVVTDRLHHLDKRSVIENSRLPGPPLDWRDTGRFYGHHGHRQSVPGIQAVHNRSPESKASFPMVQKVPTVQFMGPCLMSP